MNITAGRFTMDLFSAGYKANTGAGNLRHDPAFRFAASYLDGSGALQWNKHYSKVHTLSALEVLTLTLSSGLTDPFGDAFAPGEVKVFAAYNDGTVALDVAGDFGFTFPLPAGAVFGWCAVDATGTLVTASSKDTLTITNGSASTAGSVRLVICGD